MPEMVGRVKELEGENGEMNLGNGREMIGG